ncbi:MAG: nicotinate-nucleotide--dimethylbenzimidazole phosphoribosyltransferase [Cyclobacteriaceae bacterium]
MRKYNIQPLSRTLEYDLRLRIDRKTKPVGALGRLEEIALQIGLIQQTIEPRLINPTILVFAADHGIAKEGVSAYPQEVTWQMVNNFLQGGAAINVFCRQHNISLSVVDAGVNFDFPKDTPGLIRNKTGKSTENFVKAPAMTVKQTQSCIDTSANIVSTLHESGCNIIGFGEMGIGNTSSASVLMSVITGLPLKACIGRGTGLDDAGLNHKHEILSKAIQRHGKPNTILKTLCAYGGFEIAQMVGSILQAASDRMIIMIDGFIATVAYLVAHAIEPSVKDYCIFCHQSGERGHAVLLDHIKVKPLLNLDMRLGEATGVAMAFPIIQSAVNVLNEMASFESAQVSGKI